MSTAYLAHHGVLGQKWGVRRYQNADGTLTEAGKKKYFRNNSGKIKRINRRNLKKFDYKKDDRYKNADHREKTRITNQYNHDALWLGDTSAKKLYLVESRNGNRRIAAGKEYVTQIAKSIFLTEEAMSHGYYTKAGARFIAGSVAKTTKGVATKAAARKAANATTKIAAKSLKRVAKDVYEWR